MEKTEAGLRGLCIREIDVKLAPVDANAISIIKQKQRTGICSSLLQHIGT